MIVRVIKANYYEQIRIVTVLYSVHPMRCNNHGITAQQFTGHKLHFIVTTMPLEGARTLSSPWTYAICVYIHKYIHVHIPIEEYFIPNRTY